MQVRDTLLHAQGDALPEPRDIELREQLEARDALLY